MKPNLTWTKADAKRAEKMGWMLWPTGATARICCTTNDHFKSDAEAARWVVDALWETSYQTPALRVHWRTYQKAVLICCGGEQ